MRRFVSSLRSSLNGRVAFRVTRSPGTRGGRVLAVERMLRFAYLAP